MKALTRDSRPSLPTNGRPSYFDDEMRTVFRLLISSLDACGIPSSLPECQLLMGKIKTKLNGSSTAVPSMPTVVTELNKLNLRRRTIRHSPGGGVRASKSSPGYLVPFFELVEQLINDHQVVPQLLFNADEMGINPAAMKIRVVTSRATARVDFTVKSHVTWMLAVSATGHLTSSGLIFEGQSVGDIPTEALTAPDLWSTFSPKGFMDSSIFLNKFCIDLVERVDELRQQNGLVGRNALLVIDGHSSRLDADAMMTLASHRILVVCLPSHTTHVLQPLDSGVNRVLKLELANRLHEQLKACSLSGRGLSSADIAHAVCSVQRSFDVSNVIRRSFRHVGLYPLDVAKVAAMVQQERALQFPELQFVVGAVEDKLDQLKEVIQEKKSRDEQLASNRRSSKRLKLDTSQAVQLNSPETMSLIRTGAVLARLRQLDAGELRKEALRIGVPERTARDGVKWKSKKKLLELVETVLEERQARATLAAKKRLEQVIVTFDGKKQRSKRARR